MPRNVIIVRICSAVRTGYLVYLVRREVNESQTVLRDIRGNGHLFRIRIDIFITVNSFAN
jgi:hypothetical protein